MPANDKCQQADKKYSQEKPAVPSQSPGKRAAQLDRNLVAIATALQVNPCESYIAPPISRCQPLGGCCSGSLGGTLIPPGSAVTRVHCPPVHLEPVFHHCLAGRKWYPSLAEPAAGTLSSIPTL